MKELIFKNNDTGEVKAVYCSDTISNIDASREFRSRNGKQWGLVMSKQWVKKP